MRLAFSFVPLLLVPVLARAAPASAAPAIPKRPDLVLVSRAMAHIDGAERRGELGLERQERSKAAADAPGDVAARFLAIYAQPAGEERWSAFKALTKDFPHSAFGEIGMASVYVIWGMQDQVEKSVGLALATEPDAWLAVLVRGEAYEKKLMDEKAASDFAAVLVNDPDNSEAHVGLARIARRAHDLARAKAEGRAATTADKNFAPALEILAKIAEDEGDEKETTELWLQVVNASPMDREARSTLADLLAKAGDFKGARDEWKAALKIREDAKGLRALAAAARSAGDVDTEREALERLAAVDRKMIEWKRLAEIRLAASDWDGALIALHHALELDPHDGKAQLGIAQVHLARGETVEAVEALRAAGDLGKESLRPISKRIHLEPQKAKDVNVLQRSVSKLVQKTYRARLLEATGLSGEIRMRVTVDTAGSSTLIEVLDDSLHDADVCASAYWNLHDASYPQGKPGRYTFTFGFGKEKATAQP